MHERARAHTHTHTHTRTHTHTQTPSVRRAGGAGGLCGRVSGVTGRPVRAVPLSVLTSARRHEHAVHAVPAHSCLMLAGRRADMAQAVGHWGQAHAPARPQTPILHLQCCIIDNMIWVSSWTEPWKYHSLICMVNSHMLLDFCDTVSVAIWNIRIPDHVLWSGFHWAMLCYRGICYGPVSVCLSFCPSVCHKAEFYKNS